MINFPTDDLDINGRMSAKSSSQQSETAEGTKSVLKAVMLLKRSRGSLQIDKKNDELESNSSAELRENEVKLKLRLKRGVKSAPNVKHRNAKNLKTNTTGLSRNKHKQFKFANHKNVKRPMTEHGRTSQSLVRHSFRSDSAQNSQKTSSKRNNTTRLEEPRVDRLSSSPIPRARKQGTIHKHELDDRWVAGDKKFKVKEIVNTRIPGKENPVDVYRRFEPSMFAYIDTMNSFEKEKAADPFGAKLKARAWLKQAKERLASGGSEYKPGQSPIIVIEELWAQDESWDGGDGHESDDQRRDEVDHEILETLLEDSDKENVAEEVTKFE
jgi:hypothetical protein